MNRTIKGHIAVLITLWVFFTMLLISALMTPPDAETWAIAIACALIILIGSGSLVAKIREEKRRMQMGSK